MEYKISVIVPVYNSEKYLSSCLDSIVNQTYENLEIICINDGSVDGSLEILDFYQNQDSRIKVITQINKGPSGARNRGLVEVTGHYIMFVDADDWIDLNCCEIALKKSIKYNADVVLWPYIKEFFGYSRINMIFSKDIIIYLHKDVERKLHRRFFGLLNEELKHPEDADSLVTAWGKLYKAHLVKNKETRFIDTKLIGSAEDAWFNIQVFSSVKQAVFTSEIFYHYRKYYNASFTTKYRPDLFDQWQYLFDLMRKYIKDNKLHSIYSQSLDNRIRFSIIGLGLNVLSANASIFAKLKAIRKILSNKQYRSIYKNISLKYLPIHWKVFFFFATKKFSFGVYLLLFIISKKIGR